MEYPVDMTRQIQWNKLKRKFCEHSFEQSSDSNQSSMNADAARITLDEPDIQPSLEASADKKRKPTRASSGGNYMQQLLEVEEQKLEIAP
uniref:Uncharacterized protein n=1 Tax=Magallana gigas TaxID=29159 RepID=A0A8W8MX05_MAGGI